MKSMRKRFLGLGIALALAAMATGVASAQHGSQHGENGEIRGVWFNVASNAIMFQNNNNMTYSAIVWDYGQGRERVFLVSAGQVRQEWGSFRLIDIRRGRW